MVRFWSWISTVFYVHLPLAVAVGVSYPLRRVYVITLVCLFSSATSFGDAVDHLAAFQS
jgi:hypothetical protein